jgi:hypothetical protein
MNASILAVLASLLLATCIPEVERQVIDRPLPAQAALDIGVSPEGSETAVLVVGGPK